MKKKKQLYTEQDLTDLLNKGKIKGFEPLRKINTLSKQETPAIRSEEHTSELQSH